MISENIRPLNGTYIQMVPMEAAHKAELTAILSNPLIWEFTWRKITSTAQAEQLIDSALMNKEKGYDLPFVMLDRSTGRVAGTSRIMHIDHAHRNAEIGCTWIDPDYWRTPVNTEGKALLLQHCFEELGLIRVNFTIVRGNLRSQRAIERIGAVKEGILRKHRTTSEGTVVDNVLYSIVDEEWPGIKANLHYLLQEKYV